jgi:hypothetical protein
MMWVFYAIVFIFWIYHQKSTRNSDSDQQDYDSDSQSETEDPNSDQQDYDSDSQSETEDPNSDQQDYDSGDQSETEDPNSDQQDYDSGETEEPIEYINIPFKTGWKRGTTIMVKYSPDVIEAINRSEDGYYAGDVIRKNRSGYDVFFERTGNTDTISPFEMDWYYKTDINMKEWVDPPKIILEYKSMKPFRYTSEKQGEWHGAKTCRTILQTLPIWSIPNTPFVYVGHFGVFECVNISSDGIIEPVYGIPEDTHYIGKRKLPSSTHFRDFKPLYIERQIVQEFDLQRSTVDPIYEIPTREELG